MAVKRRHSPDVNVVIADKGFADDVLEFRIRVHYKGDELWIGLTDNPNLHSEVHGGEIRNHPRMCVARLGGAMGPWERTLGLAPDPPTPLPTSLPLPAGPTAMAPAAAASPVAGRPTPPRRHRTGRAT